MSDLPIRNLAFAWLRDQVAMHGEVLPWQLLSRGFDVQGTRVPLVSQQGIFKPKLMRLPLSIRTSPGGPYDDSFRGDGMLAYRYRGSDPQHRENVALRETMRQRIPLIYFYGHLEGRYHALWPAFIVGDDPAALTFTVAVESEFKSIAAPDTQVAEGWSQLDRRYATIQARRRLHQSGFREHVLLAYGQRCALCQLRHAELLEAAHIIPDREEGGLPVVPNGISLCKLHHAAFDANILGIRPDYIAEIREDVLEEIDGPMLRHGLQQLHGSKLHLPRRGEWKPDVGRLQERYRRFRVGA